MGNDDFEKGIIVGKRQMLWLIQRQLAAAKAKGAKFRIEQVIMTFNQMISLEEMTWEIPDCLGDVDTQMREDSIKMANNLITELKR